MRIAVLVAAAAVLVPAAEARQQKRKKVALPPDSVYLIPAKSLEGKPVDLKEYAGTVTLVVNLASQ
jgi:hypothetical protein